MFSNGAMTSLVISGKSMRSIARWMAFLFFVGVFHQFALLATDEEPKKVYVCPPCNNECDKLEHDEPGTCSACGMGLVEKTAVPAEEKETPHATYICPPCGNDCDKVVHKKPGTCTVCGMTLVEKKEEGDK